MVKNELTHPENLIEGNKYTITLRDGRSFGARFMGLWSKLGKLQLKLRLSGQLGHLPWKEVAAIADRG